MFSVLILKYTNQFPLFSACKLTMARYVQMHMPGTDAIDEQAAPDFSRVLLGTVVLGFYEEGKERQDLW